jgi:hypothetical protein
MTARTPLRFTVDGAAAPAGTYVHATPDHVRTARFSDGSEVVFAAGASGRVAEVDPRGARVLLEAGTASFAIAHLPGARWSVELGPFVIAVIGTAFDASWSPGEERLVVHVREGEVSVSGPLATDGARVSAGQHLVATLTDGELRIGRAAAAQPSQPAQSATAAVTAVAAAQEPSQSSMGEPPSVPKPATPVVASASSASLGWAKLVAGGRFEEVVREAEARGVDRAVREAPLVDLAALADAARYAHRRELARRALLSERARFAASAEARAAAFLLGRLTEDGGGSTDGAVAWYDTYLSEAPRGAFASEALGRKLAALQKASDPRARAAAAEYLRQFPDGPYAATARDIERPR